MTVSATAWWSAQESDEHAMLENKLLLAANNHLRDQPCSALLSAAFMLTIPGLAGCKEKGIDPWRLLDLQVSETSDGVCIAVEGPWETLYYLSHAKVYRREGDVLIRLYSSKVDVTDDYEKGLALEQLCIHLEENDERVLLVNGREKRIVWRPERGSRDDSQHDALSRVPRDHRSYTSTVGNATRGRHMIIGKP